MVSTILLHWSLVESLEQEDDKFLVERAHVLRMLLRDEGKKSLELQWEVESEWQGVSTPQSYVRILDATGRAVGETPGMMELLPSELFPPDLAPSEDVTQGRDIRSRTGQLFRVVVFEVERPRGDGKQIVQIAMDRSDDEGVVRRSRRILALVLTAAMLASLFAGYQIAHRGMRPITNMAVTAATIRTGTLGERLQVEGIPAEIAVLAETFNEMLERLEDSFDRLSRFSADIAHELRTPLNNLRGEAEVALRKSRSVDDYREILSSSLEEYQRLAHIIDSLLFLARAESPEMRLNQETLDLGYELAAVKDFYEAAAQEKDVDIRVEAPPCVLGDVDRTLFQRALGNLVSNALAHTPAQGWVALRAVSEPDAVRVEVSDNGVGIAPEHLSHIFDRFYRADGARSRTSGGVGLGLAIVRSIASVHGGSAEIQSEPGHGTTVRLKLPKMTKS
jgi:two-component system heavy metal sensor histidine kinase CusS